MITVVMGPPAAGKTTHVAENKAAGDVVVDFNAITLALGNEEDHDPPEPVAQVTFAARTAAIARIFDGIDGDAWIIAGNLDQAGIERYTDVGCKFVVVDPGKDTVIAQAEEDGRPEETFDLIDQWYENPPEIPADALKAGETMTKRNPPTGVKTLTVNIKAAGSGDGLLEGQFTGYASVFGNKDSYGDVVVKGAFAESLATYGADGAGVPAYWCHRMDDPMMNIGQTVEAREDEHGLFVKVQLDLDNPNAVYAHKLIKEGRVAQMSFAYDVLEHSWVETEDDFYFELRKLNLHEVSVVPVGANQETELLAVKSMLSGVKAGRKLSASNEERLVQARDLIGAVLDELEESDETEVSDEEPKSGKTEDPETGKVEDRTEAKAQNDDPDAALALIALAKVGASTN